MSRFFSVLEISRRKKEAATGAAAPPVGAFLLSDLGGPESTSPAAETLCVPRRTFVLAGLWIPL
jgi:hypothetical protein